MKKILAICSLALFTFPTFASTNVNLRDEMMVMAQRLNFANKAKTTEDFQNNMATFIDAAKKSQSTIPPKWNGDKSQFPGYQAGLQKVIDVANEAKHLAQENKLDEAKEKLRELQEFRKMYHQLYK